MVSVVGNKSVGRVMFLPGGSDGESTYFGFYKPPASLGSVPPCDFKGSVAC